MFDISLGLMSMNSAFLLIGGNLGNRENNFTIARGYIEQYCGPVLRSSSLYETAAWGKTDQPSFLNQALEIETELHAEHLITQVLEIEKLMGRERKERYGPRVIDIDIFYSIMSNMISFLKFHTRNANAVLH
jgi:2-amino-4-hydroxy-6-hydroxymethyldihydropteridine diphosphokinase